MRIDEVVPLPVHAIMANEPILDIAEGVGAGAADVVGRIEKTRGHAQAGFGPRLLDGAQSAVSGQSSMSPLQARST